MNEKETYKLYKAKKMWVTALAGFSLLAVTGAKQEVHADTTTNSQTSQLGSSASASQSQQPSSTTNSATNGSPSAQGSQSETPVESANQLSQSNNQQTNSDSQESQSNTKSAATNASQSAPSSKSGSATALGGTSTPNNNSVINDQLSVTVTKENFLQWFKLGGNTTYDADTNTAILTTDSQMVEGNITLKTKINANDAFLLNGTINLGSKVRDNQGADGIGIAFHHGTQGQIGFLGGGLSVKGLPTSSGFVFDTWVYNAGDHNNPIQGGSGMPYLSGFHSDIDQTNSDQPFRYDGGFVNIDASKENVSNVNVPFTLRYDGNGHMSMEYLGQAITIPVTDYQDPLALSIGASTGSVTNLQAVSVDSFTFDPAQKNTASRTIDYVDQNGNEIAPATVQSATYRRQGMLVNGQPTYTDWQLASDPNSNNFSAVTAPTIEGYTVQSGQTTTFGGMTVNEDSGQIVEHVIYTKNPAQATLNVQDSTVVAGKTASWSPAQSFLSAVNANGQQADLSQMTVTGKVDATTPGTYPVTYSYKDSNGQTITKSATVTVVSAKSSLQAQSSTIWAGSQWQAIDNLVSATDANGNPLESKDIQVSGSVDTTTAGNYPITYSYTDASGNPYSQTITIKVLADQSSIAAKASTVYLGEPWSTANSFVSATDEYGHSVPLNQVTVSENVDVNKVGTYPVTYQYTDGQGKMVQAQATVTVKKNQTQLTTKGDTLIAGPKAHWSATDDLVTAFDEDGNPFSVSQLKVAEQVDPHTAGVYPVTYTYTDQLGQQHSSTAQVTVLASHGSVTTRDSTAMASPTAKWIPQDNLVSAVDDSGQTMDVRQLTVDGQADLTKAGTYSVHYSYTDAAGNNFGSTATITVTAPSTTSSSTSTSTQESTATSESTATNSSAATSGNPASTNSSTSTSTSVSTKGSTTTSESTATNSSTATSGTPTSTPSSTATSTSPSAKESATTSGSPATNSSTATSGTPTSTPSSTATSTSPSTKESATTSGSTTANSSAATSGTAMSTSGAGSTTANGMPATSASTSASSSASGSSTANSASSASSNDESTRTSEMPAINTSATSTGAKSAASSSTITNDLLATNSTSDPSSSASASTEMTAGTGAALSTANSVGTVAMPATTTMSEDSLAQTTSAKLRMMDAGITEPAVQAITPANSDQLTTVLPKTAEKAAKNQSTSVGIGLVALLGSLVLVIQKKKKEK
ncbi:bacterial Ig-like domain-containing protein [Fructobacillus evanidus]|uniref:Leucine-rich repeat (LRR) protein (LRR) n=1 Tax=Fructobacillus evanidus TaxID=3064281 RepID=A0ABN9YPX8_9LACO|nr:Leucine-rich repeat (LRR) protein (LRR) [Fructobacillus sp. LMG 32999]CAK1233502.1 Leucine-rich repeat (LRR) protein (LRR) [Fructobacillus sp. LMG 32999]CAK1236198.1 Leucine-rich repeat (LRR) protein (LRR) [Fructobacillus sp. LMG 32999]CAK1236931.1 Leucine-rich repeat (LRR) protein (LRR) [Fructobacillus sp. LMG 32999]CAK1237125.1 Leucine-rich repeat (LRR) protein (LRR) [Fructobacillus sp. LMG 32999]